MAGEIIMPVLGMAQEKGLITAWLKQVGDAVKEDDILFEVETDKTNVEVPAGKTGYVAALYVEAGTEVPVGETIAFISAEKLEAGVAKPAVFGKATVEETVSPIATPVDLTVGPEMSPPIAPTPLQNRILASPKAKRLAAEQGLRLEQLVAQGVSQPYHAEDIGKILLPVPELAPAAAARDATWCEYDAVVESEQSLSLLAWISEKTGQPLTPSTLWAAFAAGALDNGDVRIRVENENGSLDYNLAPRTRLSQLAATDAADPPDLIIHDLSATRVSAFRGGNGVTPILAIARGKMPGTLALTLRFDESRMPRADALRFLESYLARMEDPLNHLL